MPTVQRRTAPAVVLAGVAGGAVGAAYVAVLHVVQRFLWPTHWSDWSHAVLLVLVGLCVAGAVRLLGSPGDVDLLVDNIHVRGGPAQYRSLVSLIPVSLLCIGVGGALGPEAPLVTTTGTLGSWLGTRARLAPEELRVVTITGMAAGFTVLFGAPLGAAIFALEILHRRGLEYYEALLPAVAGALCGYGVYVGVTASGLAPVWQLPDAGTLHGGDLGWAVACGVVGGAVALAFIGTAAGLRAVAHRLPSAARPVLGGAVLALLAVVTPYALTFGEAQITQLTRPGVAIAAGTLALAAVGKLAATSVTLASEWKGGFIIPLFFIGVCLGMLGHHFFSGANEWVLVPCLMVATNVGVTKTPIGTTLVVTEMAGLKLLPTTLIAAVVALLVTSGFGLIESQRRREVAA
jgi:H+/Cl- antiporter ClcA